MSTKTRFKKEAKGNSEMSIDPTSCQRLLTQLQSLNFIVLEGRRDDCAICLLCKQQRVRTYILQPSITNLTKTNPFII